MSGSAEKVHVVLAADEAYRIGRDVAQKSIAASCSQPERLVFHLFDEDPALSRRMRREFGTYKSSPMAFLRLYLGELLADVDWVIWSDVDTLWYRDILELAGLFDPAQTIQWVKDFDWAAAGLQAWCQARGVDAPFFTPERYACSGVCIINLKRWRERHILEKCVAFVRRYGMPPFADQGILNVVLAQEAGLLPSWWDVLIPTPEDTHRCVLHLISVGLCFKALYKGTIVEYRWWEHVARGAPFKKPRALPFYVRRWMVRLFFPFAGRYFCDRIRRRLAWRWFFGTWV